MTSVCVVIEAGERIGIRVEVGAAGDADQEEIDLAMRINDEVLKIVDRIGEERKHAGEK